MKPKIVAYKALPADVADYLREHAELIDVDADQPGALAAALKDADGAISSACSRR